MVFIIFIIGLAIGSFLNAYIWRTREGETHNPLQLPLILRGRDRSEPPLKSLSRAKSRDLGGKGEEAIENSPPLVGGVRGGGKNVWHGRSICPKCRKPLVWYELIPLLSFALQRGRCRGCHGKIDWQYPAVELVTGILFLLAYINGSPPSNILHFTFLILHLYLLSVLVILFVYDLRYGLVPDRVVLPAIGVATLYNVIPSIISGQALSRAKDLALYSRAWDSSAASLRMTLGGLLLAIAVGAGFFAIQYYLSRGRWLGAGDIRIGALMGAMLGWPLVLAGLVVSYVIGGAVALLLIVIRKKRFGQTLPLGTFLTVGTAIVFLYGEQIWKWYWRI